MRSPLLSCFLFTLTLACQQFDNCEDCNMHNEEVKERADMCKWCSSSSTCLPQSAAHSACPSNGVARSAYNCPRTQNKARYNEAFARLFILPQIAATYGETEEKVQDCLDHIPGGETTVVGQWTVECNSYVESCSGILTIDHSTKRIGAMFRPSLTKFQMFRQELDFIFNSKIFHEPTGGKVYLYYDVAAENVWVAGLGEKLKELKAAYPSYSLLLGGFSLGGPMASLNAARVVHEKIFRGDEVQVMTIGEPRTGDRDYAEGFDRIVPHAWRVTHDHDALAYWPLHVRNNRDSPHHHRFQILYEHEKMRVGDGYRVCEQAEDDRCTASMLASPTLHSYYFDRKIKKWFHDKKCELLPSEKALVERMFARNETLPLGMY